jgi:hypothetical protein
MAVDACRLGFSNVEIFLPQAPIVMGDLLSRPGKPTALVYGHYV